MLSQSPDNSTPAQAIRVLIADRNRMSNQLLAESLGRDPRFEIVGLAAPSDILSMVVTLQPHVAVISADFDGAAKKGLQVARTLNRREPSLRVVILLEMSNPESVIGAFRCGASGVFCRSQSISELTSCLERVSRGEIGASPAHSEFLLEALRSTPSCEGIEADKINQLSRRELQVVEHAAQGESNKQIADHLGLSEHTVKNYLLHVFEKLGVSNRIELLFLLFKCHVQAASLGGLGNDLGQSIATYIKAAEEGVVAAQFIVGLAHLEGYGIEKNEQSAYYWLRMAEENSGAIEQRSRALLEKVRSAVKTEDVDAVEQMVATWVQENKLLRSKHPAEFIRTSADPGPLQMLRESSPRGKAKAAS
jgi:two-component system, NarL family, nitrate/nitrite response regulator NarL